MHCCILRPLSQSTRSFSHAMSGRPLKHRLDLRSAELLAAHADPQVASKQMGRPSVRQVRYKLMNESLNPIYLRTEELRQQAQTRKTGIALPCRPFAPASQLHTCCDLPANCNDICSCNAFRDPPARCSSCYQPILPSLMQPIVDQTQRQQQGLPLPESIDSWKTIVTAQLCFVALLQAQERARNCWATFAMCMHAPLYWSSSAAMTQHV